MTILSLIYISIVTFRFSELQKFKKLTSRVPVFGIQEVKEIDFKNSAFRNTAKINILTKRTMLCTGIVLFLWCVLYVTRMFHKIGRDRLVKIFLPNI